MKKLILGLLIATSITAVASTYQNGTYRGNFIDGQENQVTVEFKLKDDIVTSAKYRNLFYKGEDYLKTDTLSKLKEQYDALLKYAVGKNVDEAMKGLYTPEKIELAGATIRSGKVRSAFKDGLIHEPYSLEK